MRKSRMLGIGTALAIAVFVSLRAAREAPPQAEARDGGGAAIETASGAALVESLQRQRRSGVMVESEGRVSRILPDDREGSRHQRFILEIAPGTTVLVAHNIDLAPRAPIDEGDGVAFKGQYEWNDRGGVIHWTHHDPDGRHPGGWLRHEGRVYE